MVRNLNTNDIAFEPAVGRIRRDRHALRSTGPRSDDGKARSSLNSLRHGLTARTVVIRGEDQADFDRLLEDLTRDRNPQGELEIQLVGEIAACLWRLARARQHESDLLQITADAYDKTNGDHLQLILRYGTAIERQLNRAVIRLERMQAARPAPQTPAQPEPLKVMCAGSSRPREFVSQIYADGPEPAATAPVAQAETGDANPSTSAPGALPAALQPC